MEHEIVKMRALDPKEMAASFALAVTEQSVDENSWIIKNGDESLYQTLLLLFPEVAFTAFPISNLLKFEIRYVVTIRFFNQNQRANDID